MTSAESRLETLLKTDLDWKDFNDEWSLRCTGARLVERELFVQLLAVSPTTSRSTEVPLCTFPAVTDDAHQQRVERALRGVLMRCQTTWLAHVSPGLTGQQVMDGGPPPPPGDPFEPFARLHPLISQSLATTR